ncbi:carboxymuconolactone decarboxylase family protein [Streptomyces sp. TRM 70351]|uniref:carboxymuconolactone decarboxylase family protein n=1 Tax=Streptomyces sp. TRM 70351 TaxID=3116552 RepID=UPI002E7C1DE4|nr:carboxymuconolactone decarboxylase family protein [Streptomyces sp. TRM 70351]MEE1927088.1 carboxymuconolactone decarboxylase family protein [Streptomyces sp. TRM 70351]
MSAHAADVPWPPDGAPGRPRIAPQPEALWAASARDVLDTDLSASGLGAGRLGDLHLFSTLARNPDLLTSWLGFGAHLLLAAGLPAPDRELVILRVARNCRCRYEWVQHERLAAGTGLSPADVARVAEGPGAPGWSPRQALLLTAADELHAHARLSDATWAALAGELSERDLVELPMLAGHYHMLAFVINTLGIEPEQP